MSGGDSVGAGGQGGAGGRMRYAYETEDRVKSLGYIPDTILDEKGRVPRRTRGSGGSTVLVMPDQPALKGQAMRGPGFILRVGYIA
jgi:hypothetical protein